jgi:X-X-X-Leu-X-X-Gly heptad repeat protein
VISGARQLTSGAWQLISGARQLISGAWQQNNCNCNLKIICPSHHIEA